MGALAALLRAGAPVVLDGGLATELEARGHDLSDARWSARLLDDDPDAIVAVHEAYLRAGARIVISAGYQAADAARLGRSVALARRARDAVAPAALVAGSVGPYGALLAGGQEYTGDYGAGVDAARLQAFHAPRIAALTAAGADCLACETVPRADEAAALAAALDAAGAPDAWISFTCRDGATTAAGDPIEDAVAAATASPRVVAVGVNCTAPEHVEALLRRARTATDRPLVAYPNSGRVWDGARRAWTAEGADVLPAAAVAAWQAAGAQLVGGCCGLGPGAIAALAGATSPATAR